jgi:steroid delta-isomerase-like uncharacterized protein
MATAADITRRIFQAYNDRDLDGMLASVNPDVQITLPGGQLISGREEMRAHEQQEWEGFPDARVEVRQVIDQGSMAVGEYIWAATNTGPLNLPDGSTLPATGKRIELPCVTVVEVKDGLVAAERSYWDMMEAFQQMGLLPATATA